MAESTSQDARWSERGIALITGLMLLFMASSLLVGFLTVVMSDSRVRRVDKTRTQSFYAAYAGLEKLTSDLGNLFMVDFSPSTAQIQAIEAAAAVDAGDPVHRHGRPRVQRRLGQRARRPAGGTGRYQGRRIRGP